MEVKLRASDYRRKVVTPSSGLVSDVFRLNAHRNTPELNGNDPPSQASMGQRQPLGRSTTPASSGVSTAPRTRTADPSPQYVHSFHRRSLHRSGSILHNRQLSTSDEVRTSESMNAEPQVGEQVVVATAEEELDKVEQSSLMCCAGSVVSPISGRGIWSSTYLKKGCGELSVEPTQSTMAVGDAATWRPPLMDGRRGSTLDEERSAPFTTIGGRFDNSMSRSTTTPPLGNHNGKLVVGSRALTPIQGTRAGRQANEVDGLDPLLVYRVVEQRLQRELTFLATNAHGGSAQPEERFRVFRESAMQLSMQVGDYAPVIRTLFEEYNVYVEYLENRCLQVNAAERERDECVRNLEVVRQRCEAQMRENAAEFNTRLEAIQTRLRTSRNVEQLVNTIKGLEGSVENEKRRCRALEEKIQTIGFLREEFEKSLHQVEESFLMLNNERDMELGDYRRERLRTYDDLLRTKDACRQTVADMQMRLDAQQIVLETQMQREQFSADQIRDLQLYSLTLLQSVESLKKQLSELNARALSTEMSPRSTANGSPALHHHQLPSGDDVDGAVAAVDTVTGRESPVVHHPILGALSTDGPRVGGRQRHTAHEQSPRRTSVGGGAGGGGSSSSSFNAAASVAADLGLSQLSTPRPNKAEIVARVPDLGDPSKYPSTSAIIHAMLNHFDFTSKRLADATHTLNKLEERIEVVVLARAELLSREKLEKLLTARNLSELNPFGSGVISTTSIGSFEAS